MPAAIPFIPAIIGGVAGLVGAHKQAKATENAANQAAQAAQFNPYNVSGLFGSANFSGNNASVTPDQQQAQQRALLGQFANNQFSGNTANSPFQQFAQGIGNQGLPQLFGGALDQSNSMPNISGNQNMLSALMSQLGGAGQGSLAASQGLYGQGQQALQGAFGGIGGASNMFGQGMQNLMGQVQGSMNFDPSQMVSDRLNLLRQQAAPQEQQQQQALENRLFSQGRSGSTGGALQTEAFARGLGQADLGRQVEAQNLGLQAQGQAANIGLNYGGLGLQGLGTQAGLLNNQVGQYAGLSQGLFGNALDAQGQASNMLGLVGNLNQSQLSNAMGYSDTGNARAQQRLQNAMGLFGLGQDVGTQNFNQGLSAMQGQQSIDQQMQNLIALGGNLGGTQAQAGANQARAYLTNNGSPTGSFLGGLGTGLLNIGLQPQPNYGFGNVSTGGAQMLPGGYNFGQLPSTMMPMPQFGG